MTGSDNALISASDRFDGGTGAAVALPKGGPLVRKAEVFGRGCGVVFVVVVVVVVVEFAGVVGVVEATVAGYRGRACGL